jgi:hypothetical protein
MYTAQMAVKILENEVLETIRKNSGISNPDICRKLGLDFDITVGKRQGWFMLRLLENLMEANLIEQRKDGNRNFYYVVDGVK